VSASSDHLDWLGTGFSDVNGAGPAETALRIDVPLSAAQTRIPHGHRRFAKKIAEAKVADAIRRLRLDVTLACIDVGGLRLVWIWPMTI
jgi:hypothetical protein